MIAEPLFPEGQIIWEENHLGLALSSLALVWALACVHYSVHKCLENKFDLQLTSFVGSNVAMKSFSFKQSRHFIELEVKKGAKHTFDHESFGVLP